MIIGVENRANLNACSMFTRQDPASRYCNNCLLAGARYAAERFTTAIMLHDFALRVHNSALSGVSPETLDGSQFDGVTWTRFPASGNVRYKIVTLGETLAGMFFGTQTVEDVFQLSNFMG